ncbi:MAG: 2-amino-4-hydroxy-6-hydroxymethyldihydropteridine diphosphokinase [Ignavibacteriaceae bacterium]
MITNSAYIALGSNRGDKVDYLRKAVQMLVNDPNCSVVISSSIYETKPYGIKEQDNFLNAAIGISTLYKLYELFICLKNIEKQLGRLNGTKWGPREIDLDLLFFNDIVYSDERITIPHKEIEHRDFVLAPLCEIAPNLFHPVLNQKISDICIDEKDRTIIKKIPDKIL